MFGYHPAFSVTSMVGLLFHLHQDAGLRTLCEAFFADFQPVGPSGGALASSTVPLSCEVEIAWTGVRSGSRG
jgi:hypothetical protein